MINTHWINKEAYISMQWKKCNKWFPKKGDKRRRNLLNMIFQATAFYCFLLVIFSIVISCSTHLGIVLNNYVKTHLFTFYQIWILLLPDTHTVRMKTLIKLKIRTSTILKEIKNFSRKICSSPAAKFLPSVYQYLWSGQLECFCLENIDDVMNLGRKRKEVCWISICMLTSAGENTENDQNNLPYQRCKEKEIKRKQKCGGEKMHVRLETLTGFCSRVGTLYTVF